MFVKYFVLLIILNFVVQAPCQESHEVPSKQETITELENETKAEETVHLSDTANAEITLPSNGSEIASTTSIVSDLSTSILLNETDYSTVEIEDVTLATTALDVGSNSTYNVTDTTAVEDDTETTSQYSPAASTVPDNGTITDDSSETTTDLVSQAIAVDVTDNSEDTSIDIVTNSTTATDSATNATTATDSATNSTTVTDSTTPTDYATNSTTATDSATNSTTATDSTTPTDYATNSTTATDSTTTTPIDILCPQIQETEIDPKYRNETFDLYLEEFLKKNPLAKIYKSPGFPAPYAENLNCTLSVTLSNCTGVDILVHYLDLDPFEHDSLNIRGGEEDATDEKGKELTGRQFGVSFKIIHSTSLYIWFQSKYHGTGEYRGFLLTYAPYGNDTVPPTTTEAPITIPQSEVQFYELQLVLQKSNRTNETWKKFKDVLASSASTYVTEQNLNYELALPDNVTINIFDCPNNWPNYENCVRLRFSITLWNLDYNPDIHYDLTIFDYELSTNSLSNMWDLYGRDDFLEILRVEEYSIPDGTYILLLWTGISLTIVVIFIGVLYSIWRIDIFREYRRMNNRSDDQQDILKSKSELDISMYPIPHQPYPTLFETAEMNSGGYYDSYETNSTSFQAHSFQEKPSSANYRHSTTAPFTPNIMDFNDTQLFPDDEDNFGRVQPLSPRSKQKLLVLGAKRDESNT